MRAFEGSDHKDCKKGGKLWSNDKMQHLAMKLAEDALQLSLEERIEQLLLFKPNSSAETDAAEDEG